jgi:CubicO group peptidase (beta-lactamase class C family)
MTDLEARIQRIENNLKGEDSILRRSSKRQSLNQRMKAHYVPGLSVAVINDYQLEWARGYGVREWGTANAVDTNTLFQAASISKPVTAIAALRLVEAGKLALDEDVNRYLSSWQIPANGSWQPRITLRHLLSHTGGLTVHGFLGYGDDEVVPSLHQILDGEIPANSEPIRVNILPGISWRYAGGGYCILQQMLEDVTGKPFSDLMNELVFEPLGMMNSRYEHPLTEQYWLNAAHAHYYTSQPIKGKWYTYPELAAAGLWTTPSDLARLVIEIQLASAGKSTRLLSQSMVEQMLSPVIKADEGAMGLGFFLLKEGSALRFGHGGDNVGYKAIFMAYREHGQGAIIMANGDQGDSLKKEVLDAIAEEYNWLEYLPDESWPMDDKPTKGTDYEGEYQLTPFIVLKVQQDEDALQLLLPDQAPMPLLPLSETTFRVQDVEAIVEFVRIEGMTRSLVLKQSGSALTASRVD